MIEDATLEPLRARGYELGGFLGSGAFSEVKRSFFRLRKASQKLSPFRLFAHASYPPFLSFFFFFNNVKVIAATQTSTGAQVAIKRVTGGGADAAAFAASKRRSVRLPSDDSSSSLQPPPPLAPPPAPGAREAAALRELRGHPNVIQLLDEVELVREREKKREFRGEHWESIGPLNPDGKKNNKKTARRPRPADVHRPRPREGVHRRRDAAAVRPQRRERRKWRRR